MYDIKDILQKAIVISEKKKELYLEIAEDVKELRFRILVSTMIRGVDRDIAYYKRMIVSIGDIAEAIDVEIYDVMSSRINQFMRTLVKPQIRNVKELIAFATQMEQAVYALLVDVQGRLVRNDKSVEASVTYYVLAELILEKEKTIRNFNKYLG